MPNLRYSGAYCSIYGRASEVNSIPVMQDNAGKSLRGIGVGLGASFLSEHTCGQTVLLPTKW